MTPDAVTGWVMIPGGVVVAILLFLLLRFVVLWYWRIDEIVSRICSSRTSGSLAVQACPCSSVTVSSSA
jgi:hypothetical protein